MIEKKVQNQWKGCRYRERRRKKEHFY